MIQKLLKFYKKVFALTLLLFLILPYSVFNIITVKAIEPSRPNAGEVIINELMWSGSLGIAEDEWIELQNRTSVELSLAGCYLTRIIQVTGEERLMLTIPDNSTISPNGFFLISNFDQFQSAISIMPDVVNPAITLNNTRLKIRLYCPGPQGNILLDTAGDGSAPLAGKNSPPPKKSMERKCEIGDGTLGSSWQTASQSVGWNINAQELGTPRSLNSGCIEPSPIECNNGVKEENEECDGTDGVGEHQICNDQCELENLSTLSGCKFLDSNRNAQKDQDETLLAGWTIHLKQNQSIIQAAITDQTGCFTFQDVQPGDYSLEEVVQESYTQTSPLLGKHDVTVTTNQNITNLDFGNALLCGNEIVDAQEQCDLGPQNGVECTPGYGETCSFCSSDCQNREIPGPYCGDITVQNENNEECDDGNNADGDGCSAQCKTENLTKVAGCKFSDDNGNGVWDQGELTLPDWEIQLKQGDTVIQTANTGVNGCYEFLNVLPGDYDVFEIFKSNYIQTFPVSGNHSIQVAINQDINDLNFGNKFERLCGNSVINQGEQCDRGQENNGVQCTPDYSQSCTYCSSDCQEITLQGPYCGDGNIDSPQEDCDGGDNCTGDCEIIPPPPTGQICGVKFNDHNGNGQIDIDDENLSDWTINLYEKMQCTQGDEWADQVRSFNQGKKKDGSDIEGARSDPNSTLGQAEQTDADFTFFSLGFGGEIVLEFTNIIENGISNDIIVYESTPNRDIYPQETAQVFASQNGSTWELLGQVDNKNNNTLDLGTLPWAQFIKIMDTTDASIHNEIADGFDVDGVSALNCKALDQLDSVDTTDSGYCFENLSDGMYHVSEELQGGWINTTAIGQQVEINAQNNHQIVNFGNTTIQDAQEASICGYKFEDVNGDGVWQPNDSEQGLPNWTMQAMDSRGFIFETQTSDSENNRGEYCFHPLDEGRWKVNEVLQEGWVSTTQDFYELTLNAGEGITNINFGNFETATIQGQKFEDKNNNGLLEPDELPIFGWNIFLTLIGQNSITTATTTKESGLYQFQNLGPGTYQITEGTSTEWVMTFPHVIYEIVTNSGRIYENFDFYNFHTPIIIEEPPPAPTPTPPSGGGGGGGGPIGLGAGSIHTQGSIEVNTTTATVNWFTNVLATSRVVYDTVSHLDLGSAPNYGYAFSTDTDLNKVTFHTMILTGLIPGTTYYWRPVSSASPDQFGSENAFITLALQTVPALPEVVSPPAEQEGVVAGTELEEVGTGGPVPEEVTRTGSVLGAETGEETAQEPSETEIKEGEVAESPEGAESPKDLFEEPIEIGLPTSTPISASSLPCNILISILLVLCIIISILIYFNDKKKKQLPIKNVWLIYLIIVVVPVIIKFPSCNLVWWLIILGVLGLIYMILSYSKTGGEQEGEKKHEEGSGKAEKRPSSKKSDLFPPID